MEDIWWFENDGYGIIGWSFMCEKCGKSNRFADTIEKEMICEHCSNIIYFTQGVIDCIENTL